MLAGPAQAATTTRHPHRPAAAGVSLAEGRAAVRAAGGDVTGHAADHQTASPSACPPRARARLAHDARIASISANAPIRSQSDRFDPAQLATAYPASVFAPPAWTHAPTGAGVGVAVIDTGIDGGLPSTSPTPQGASRVVASVVTNPDATTPNDNYGHGTHVAGIIAGDGTRRAADDPLAGRYVGIAPDANLIAIKASDDAGHGTILDAIYGLQFAVDHKDRLQHPRRQPVGVVDGRRVLPDRPARRRRRGRVLPRHPRRRRRRQPRHRRRRDGLRARATTRSRSRSAPSMTRAPTQRGDDAFADVVERRHRRRTAFAKPEIAAPGAHIVSTLAAGSAFAELCPQCIVDGSYMQTRRDLDGGARRRRRRRADRSRPHPDWTPDQVKSTLIATGRDVPRRHRRGQRGRRDRGLGAPSSGANAGIVPNDLLDPPPATSTTTRSSWGRSSWGNARPARWSPAGRARAGAASATDLERGRRIDAVELGKRDVARAMERLSPAPSRPGMALRASWGRAPSS